MIINVRLNNCSIFSDEVNFSLKADMRTTKFFSNIYSKNNFNILKVAGIYGTNNSGKTCLIKCIKNIKNVFLNKPTTINSNLFSDSDISELGITFLLNDKKYDYCFKYDTSKKEYLYEKFSEIDKNKNLLEKEKVLLLRDIVNKKYKSVDKNISSILSLLSKDNISIYQIDANQSKSISEIKSIMVNFAEKIDIIDMNNISMSKTIDILKNRENLSDKIVDFIKKADLYMDDFKYNDSLQLEYDGEQSFKENVKIPQSLIDQMKLMSVYNGKKVPSIIYDSIGTKKMEALAGYIVEALKKGKILVIDEIDSSIHFKLTRDIISMFNNELNSNAQLIFTAHDINLMDCQKLLRKEQIWFIHKDKNKNYLYSLGEFTSNDGVRDTSNIIEKYKRGLFGALPEPNLIETLISIVEV